MLIEYLYGKILFMIFVSVCAVLDFKKRTVHIYLFIAMFVLTLAGYIWMGFSGKEILWARLGIGLLSAAAMWVIAFVTHQQLGYGDAMFFTATALVLGCKNIILIAGAMLLCAMISVGVCIAGMIKKKSVRDYSLPLLPIALPVAFGVIFVI